MPHLTLVVSILASVAAAEEPPIIVKGNAWAPFISPMGEPFRPRATGDEPFARWFQQADRNQDGVLTPDEMQGDADRFFATLDSNHDGGIDPEELVTYESEIAPEIQVNSRWRRPRGQVSAEPRADANSRGDGARRMGRNNVDGYQINGLQGAARYGLLNIPQPVAGADADFNRLVTLGEFRHAAAYRFKLLDGNGVGRLTLDDLKARLPVRPESGRRVKRRKDAPDTRIGQPLPEGS